jgi:hypothetical protein
MRLLRASSHVEVHTSLKSQQKLIPLFFFNVQKAFWVICGKFIYIPIFFHFSGWCICKETSGVFIWFFRFTSISPTATRYGAQFTAYFFYCRPNFLFFDYVMQELAWYFTFWSDRAVLPVGCQCDFVYPQRGNHHDRDMWYGPFLSPSDIDPFL